MKLGPVHFVDFGRNMEHSPDGKAYLIGHGTGPSGRTSNWVAGDAIYLVRVDPSPSTVNDAGAYEFYAGDINGQPTWSRDIEDMEPILTWEGQLGNVAVTYNAPLDSYLMTLSRPADGVSTVGRFDTMILESDSITGPWRLVHYMREFGTQAYFANVPSKFISSDGMTFWLAYSANFTGTAEYPWGSKYALSLQEITLESAECAPQCISRLEYQDAAAPRTVVPGAEFTATLDIANSGDAPGGEVVRLYSEAAGKRALLASKFVRVEAGKTKTARFRVALRDLGSYRLTLEGKSGAISRTVAVRPRTAPFFEYSGLSVSSPIEAGDEAAVSATVENLGSMAGSTTIDLYVDGDRVQSRDVRLTAGERRRVTFHHSLTGAGFYAVGVGDLLPAWVLVRDFQFPPKRDCVFGEICEAEDAGFTGGAYVTDVHPGYSGRGFVAGYEPWNRARTLWPLTGVPGEGSYKLRLRYANGPWFEGHPDDRTLSLYVNGVDIKQITLPHTGSWSEWATRAESIDLRLGRNSIELRCSPEDDPMDTCVVNLDYLTVTQKTN